MSLEAQDYSAYQHCTLTKTPGTMRGWLDGRIEYDSGMSANPSAAEILYHREKPVLKKRKRQLAINKLGLEGGRPYVENRLSRFAAESTIDWCGGRRHDGSEATGRLQQTHAFPYLGRINEKINQYVFSTPPLREGANPVVLNDITRDGQSVNDLMRKVSAYVFAFKWCWIGVDAPAQKPDGSAYSLAEKELLKVRPYWNVYSPDEVLDWHHDSQGNLAWVKTKHTVYDDSNPATLPKEKKVVKLWTPGMCTELTETVVQGRTVIESNEIPLTLTDRVPFVLVGDPHEGPIPFDDLESICRTIMDLGSVDRANFFNCAYPQLVLPASVIQNAITSGYAANATEAGKMVVGFKSPILISKEDPQPSYLTPDSGVLAAVGERITSLKRELFEVVGLALEQESRQVASAEAKAWDFLDVAAVMRARADILEDAERKAVEISKAWDPDFPEWEPVYNRDFDVGDFQQEIAALVMAGNMPLPASVVREVAKKLVDRLDRIGSPIDAESKAKILDDIAAWEPSGFGDIPTI